MTDKTKHLTLRPTRHININ